MPLAGEIPRPKHWIWRLRGKWVFFSKRPSNRPRIYVPTTTWTGRANGTPRPSPRAARCGLFRAEAASLPAVPSGADIGGVWRQSGFVNSQNPNKKTRSQGGPHAVRNNHHHRQGPYFRGTDTDRLRTGNPGGIRISQSGKVYPHGSTENPG